MWIVFKWYSVTTYISIITGYGDHHNTKRRRSSHLAGVQIHPKPQNGKWEEVLEMWKEDLPS